MPDYRRGEVWVGGLDPVVGHEQSGKRPLLIVSDDAFNTTPAGLVIILPITSQYKRVLSHVEVLPPEGGLTRRSFIKCEDIHCISKDRIEFRLGQISDATLVAVETRIRRLLKL